MSHSRIPLFMQKLHKSWSGDSVTDYTFQEEMTVASGSPMYRTPDGRADGNVLFRRYGNGELDIDYAKNKVVDALKQLKSGVQLNSLEAAALTVMFPSAVFLMDVGLASSVVYAKLRVSAPEMQRVAMAVAEHLAAELEWARYGIR